MLPLRIRARSGEPQHSFALRLAARQRLSSVDDLLRAHAPALNGVLGPDAARVLRQLSGFDGSDRPFEEIVVSARSRAVSAGGETMLLNDWSLASRRWCAPCLRDDVRKATAAGLPSETAAWSRVEWDMRSFVACPLHLVVLSERCPRCGAGQDWSGPAVDRCRCGGDLSRAVAPPMPAQRLEWERFVSGRMAGLEGPTLLAGDTIKDVLPSIERLGFATSLPWMPTRPRTSRCERLRARVAGMATVADWPRPFRDALDQVSAGAGELGRPRGLIGGYGWIHSEWAYLPPRTRIDRAVRVELRAHAVARGLVAADEALFGEPPAGTITMKDAAGTLGMGFERARRLLDEAGAIPAGVRRGVAFPLNPAEVAAAGRSSAQRSGISEDARILGVGRSQARRLRAEFGKTPGWAADLVERVRGGAVVSASRLLSRLPHACRAVGMPLEVAIGHMLAERLTVHGVLADTAGLAGVLVRAADMRPLAGRPLSVEAAAGRLGIHHEAMRWLVAEGHVARAADGGISSAALLDFERSHVPAAALARAGGTSPRRVIEFLTSVGCAPVFGPPDCRQAIFARRRAQDLVHAWRSAAPSTIQ